jgi:hypothetical protein
MRVGTSRAEKVGLKARQVKLWEAVAHLEDSDQRQVAELFMALPEQLELPPTTDDLPKPLQAAPQGFPSGTVDKLAEGQLPNLSKDKLPEEATLRTWTRESQEAFWDQRRAYWNRMKLTELQRECRKLELWPGGDMPYVKDRLLRHDFGASLLAEVETREEDEFATDPSDIGVVYYELIEDPIDLDTIKGKIQDGAYDQMASLKQDMMLLFNNARKFDAAVSPPDQLYVTRDADALQAKMLVELGEKVARAPVPAPAAQSGAAARRPERASARKRGTGTNTCSLSNAGMQLVNGLVGVSVAGSSERALARPSRSSNADNSRSAPAAKASQRDLQKVWDIVYNLQDRDGRQVGPIPA